MKKLILIALLGIAQTAVFAQPTNWTVDPVHSFVKFSVSHMTISSVDGLFKTFSGTMTSPAKDFNNAKINFTIDVNSISTDNDMRDKHLKSDDFFNAEKYPNITFVSTSFKKYKANTYMLQGNLTIRNITKKVTIPVVYGGTIKDPYGLMRAGFKGAGKISRKEYGLLYNKLTEAGGAIVGDEVTFTVNVEVTQQK